MRDGLTPIGDHGGCEGTDVGFRIRIGRQRLWLGTLDVEVPDFSKRRDDCLSLARGLVGLCSLALANARALSRRERAEDGLRSEVMSLTRSNADLDMFACAAAHDLQAPLRRIVAFSKLLREDAGQGLGTAALDDLGHIEECTLRMRQLTEGLLASARTGARARGPADVCLVAAARQAVCDLAPRIEETGACVEIGELPTVRADAVQVYQLLQNLIGNALKFMPQGGRPHIRLSGRPVGAGMVEVGIQDNGIGFDENDLERIFRPFERLCSQGEYQGAGIGLAICRGIVQRHGGTLTARSRAGHGSTFLFTLPIAAPQGPGRVGRTSTADQLGCLPLPE